MMPAISSMVWFAMSSSERPTMSSCHVMSSCRHVVITVVFFLAVLDGVVVFAKESHRAEEEKEEEWRSKSFAHPDSRLLTNSSSLVTAIERAQRQ